MTEVFPFPKRFPELPFALLVLLYMPLGLILVFVRFFVLLHAILLSYMLPKGSSLRSVVLRCMGAVLGTFISVKRDKASASHLTIVSNHPTLFDHAVLDMVLPNYSPYSHLFHWAHGYAKIAQSNENDIDIRNLLMASAFPFHFLPEYVPTGCCDLLLNFPPVPFNLDRVQPVAISATRPLPIGLTCHPVVWWRELFWHLFVPYTHYRVQLLSTARRTDDESSAQFAQRLRRALADALNARLAPLTANDLRKQLQAAAQADAERPQQDPRLQLMMSQVAEVLPHAPAARIEAELRRTRDVDATIASLLEESAEVMLLPPPPGGLRHRAMPGSSPTPASAVCGGADSCVPPSEYKTHADSFEKSSTARQTSLLDRKRDFVANARRQYLARQARAT